MKSANNAGVKTVLVGWRVAAANEDVENVQSITHSPAYGPDGDPQGDVMLNIFYGRENLDKEKFIFESVGDRALIMVPDQYTFRGGETGFPPSWRIVADGCGNVSAASLGGNILSELGGNKRSFINKYGTSYAPLQERGEPRGRSQSFQGNGEEELLSRFGQ